MHETRAEPHGACAEEGKSFPLLRRSLLIIEVVNLLLLGDVIAAHRLK